MFTWLRLLWMNDNLSWKIGRYSQTWTLHLLHLNVHQAKYEYHKSIVLSICYIQKAKWSCAPLINFIGLKSHAPHFCITNNPSNAHSYGSTYFPNSKSSMGIEDLLITFYVLHATHVSIPTPIVKLKIYMELVMMFCAIDLDVPIPCIAKKHKALWISPLHTCNRYESILASSISKFLMVMLDLMFWGSWCTSNTGNFPTWRIVMLESIPSFTSSLQLETFFWCQIHQVGFCLNVISFKILMLVEWCIGHIHMCKGIVLEFRKLCLSILTLSNIICLDNFFHAIQIPNP